MRTDDTYWMNRCLILARKGRGSVSPNPLVGAVIVKNGRKLGEGYHQFFGGPHAEVNAVSDALSRKHILAGATIYVNLEPCSHFGKTPPCVDTLIRYGFSRVVIAMKDPNPLVSGKGIAKLKEHGISVTIGILRSEAEFLNESFITSITTQRPFIALKAAQTSDGYIARPDGTSQWITNERSRALVHRLRSEFDAVVVGAGTVKQDDPELTVRTGAGRNPVRVIIDGNFSVPVKRKIFNKKSRTIIYISAAASDHEKKKMKLLISQGITVIPLSSVNGMLDLRLVAADLYRRNIASLLVEGGAHTYESFLNAKLTEKIYLFTAKKKFGSGIKTFKKLSVSYKKIMVSERSFGSDRLQEFRITFP
ncbi:MAG: bifunctional diaminohydroxyphosphoribosylaminopyrimidine deaminase/5-amino-6-(5-phosphoribosylamino)uracil reductase RibD [Bacteroidota bacterium]